MYVISFPLQYCSLLFPHWLSIFYHSLTQLVLLSPPCSHLLKCPYAFNILTWWCSLIFLLKSGRHFLKHHFMLSTQLFLPSLTLSENSSNSQIETSKYLCNLPTIFVTQ
jgi:hypothetical protein